MGNPRPDAYRCNAVSIGPVADDVPTGRTAFPSISLTAAASQGQPPGRAASFANTPSRRSPLRVSPWAECVRRRAVRLRHPKPATERGGGYAHQGQTCPSQGPRGQGRGLHQRAPAGVDCGSSRAPRRQTVVGRGRRRSWGCWPPDKAVSLRSLRGLRPLAKACPRLLSGRGAAWPWSTPR